MSRKKSPSLFEEAMDELENLVTEMEKGDITLEESLKAFERGIKLTRTCQNALQEAEQKVRILLEKNGQQILEPFNNE